MVFRVKILVSCVFSLKASGNLTKVYKVLSSLSTPERRYVLASNEKVLNLSPFSNIGLYQEREGQEGSHLEDVWVPDQNMAILSFIICRQKVWNKFKVQTS